MKVITLRCNNCGATFNIADPNMRMCYCQYCGSQNWIDNGNRNYNVNIHKSIEQHTVNDAKIIKVKSERNRAYLNWIGWLLFGIVIVAFYVWLFWSLDEPDRNAKKSREAGLISAGNSGEYKGEDYEAVEKQIKKLGFTDVTTVDLDDSGIKFWTNEEVESVTINGDSSFDNYDYYEPDSKVIIKYH